MWIWVAMLDLKLHVFKGKEFESLARGRGWTCRWDRSRDRHQLLPQCRFRLCDLASWEAARIRSGFALARRHLGVVLGVGFIVGVALGISAVVVPRWGSPWFAISLGIVVGVMMLTYVSVPARLVGVRPTGSRRDKLAAAVVGGALGALVCTPPYVLGRIGLLLLGSHVLFPLGVILFALGLTLQAGATGAVKAIKMSAKLAAGNASATAESVET